MRKRIKPTGKKIAVYCSCLLALVSIAGICFWACYDRIMPGVTVENIELGGLTREDAYKVLMPLQGEYLSEQVDVVFGNQQWQFSRSDLGYRLELENLLEDAYGVGRRGNIGKLWQDIKGLLNSGVALQAEPSFDEKKAASILQKLASDSVVSPEDATLQINENDEVIILPGKSGKRLDLEAALEALKTSGSISSSKIILRLREVQPKITASYIQKMKIKGLLSSYTTYFDAKNVNRTYNIHVAADALDYQFIEPGEVFSFNRIVGPRSEEAGYKEALIVFENEFVPGLGGGVCQVSSTLYNAALLAGLQISERSNHSLPVSYVPLGRDATVVYAVKDLKFKNNYKSHLLIKAFVSSSSLTVKIFGDPEEKPNVSMQVLTDEILKPKIITKNDSNLYEGKEVVEQEGCNGYRVRVYRCLTKEGSAEKQLISKDFYHPLDKIVSIGTMPLPAVPDPPIDDHEGNEETPQEQQTENGQQPEQQTETSEPSESGQPEDSDNSLNQETEEEDELI